MGLQAASKAMSQVHSQVLKQSLEILQIQEMGYRSERLVNLQTKYAGIL